jgi:antitoxin component of MazEF toxin-antitoxin module
MAVEDLATLKMRKKNRKQKLSQLVRRINAANLHAETDWGPPARIERW